MRKRAKLIKRIKIAPKCQKAHLWLYKCYGSFGRDKKEQKLIHLHRIKRYSFNNLDDLSEVESVIQQEDILLKKKDYL